MKSVFLIFSFLLIIEIPQIRSHEENGANATFYTDKLEDGEGTVDIPQLTSRRGINEKDNSGIRTYQASWINAPVMARSPSMNLKVQPTNQPNSKAKADKIRETAKKDRDTALNQAKSAFNDVIAKLKIMSRESDKEQRKEGEVIEQKHKIAIDTADAIWRNACQKWANMQQNAENEYQQAFSVANQKVKEVGDQRDAALLAADKQFVDEHAQIEENRKKAESKYEELLRKSQTEYENAMMAAEKRKSQAENEFWQAASKYQMIPAEQWAKITAKYNVELETYNRALEEANRNMQNTLDKAGLGKQYWDALNRAAIDLENTQKKAGTLAMASITGYDKELIQAEKLKYDTVKLAKAGKQKAKEEHQQALDKAENEARKEVDKIFKRWEKKEAVANVHFKKAEAEFQKKKAEASKRFNEALKQATMVEKNTQKP